MRTVQNLNVLTNSVLGLSNVFQPEVLDEWFVRDVQPRMKGRCILLRYADDFVIGCEVKEGARRIMVVLPKRFARFRLTIHPRKTGLLEFRKPARRETTANGNGTFDFLGFTHSWAKARLGNWVLKLRALLQGQSDAQRGEEFVSTLVRGSPERVLQEGREPAQAAALGRGRDEARGEQLGARNGDEPGTLKTAEGVLRGKLAQMRGREGPYRSPLWGQVAPPSDAWKRVIVEREGGGGRSRTLRRVERVRWARSCGQGLAPGVQHRRTAEFRAQMVRIAGKLLQGLRGALE